ncbi:MAG TPA: DNA repair protein RecN [Syntrophorhabdales bacterium]|nr:DNA repair protein RecN [Syntrophorhabdales bacterium]
MLAYLKVKNFAIIDELEVEFKEGLNVITGETGAGKSIIINAVSALINARIPTDVVRSNTDKAEIIGQYYRKRDEYILKRIIGDQGKSRAFINEQPVTRKRLESLGEELTSIYGQGESQDLLRKEHYPAILDGLLSLEKERRLLAERVRDFKEVVAVLTKKKNEVQGRDKEIGLLQFQLMEIEKENLQEDEENTIKERLVLLKDAEKITSVLENVNKGLYEDEGSAHTILKTAVAALKSLAKVEAIDTLKGRVEALFFEVEDIAEEIKKQEKLFVYDPQQIEEMEDRLYRIRRLQDKYGKTYREIKEYEQWARNSLAYLSALSSNMEELEKKRDILEKEVTERAEHLSAERKKGAKKIEEAVARELELLSMKGVNFKIVISDKGVVDEEGRDDIEFLLSANPGEPLRPLRKVASGGELSRVMLAIKRIVGGTSGMTMIFDEIDAGIGGKVAEIVGKRLRELAHNSQVICITHLPQIAAFGDHHFLVEKSQDEGSTRTAVRELAWDERIVEIARMLGGVKITERTVSQAEEMLKNAQESKN